MRIPTLCGGAGLVAIVSAIASSVVASSVSTYSSHSRVLSDYDVALYQATVAGIRALGTETLESFTGLSSPVISDTVHGDDGFEWSQLSDEYDSVAFAHSRTDSLPHAFFTKREGGIVKLYHSIGTERGRIPSAAISVQLVIDPSASETAYNLHSVVHVHASWFLVFNGGHTYQIQDDMAAVGSAVKYSTKLACDSVRGVAAINQTPVGGVFVACDRSSIQPSVIHGIVVHNTAVVVGVQTLTALNSGENSIQFLTIKVVDETHYLVVGQDSRLVVINADGFQANRVVIGQPVVVLTRLRTYWPPVEQRRVFSTMVDVGPFLFLSSSQGFISVVSFECWTRGLLFRVVQF
jgi:hypothetical protein